MEHKHRETQIPMTKAAAEPTAHAIMHTHSDRQVAEGMPHSICMARLTLVVNALHLLTKVRGVTLALKCHPHVLSAQTLW